MFGFLIRRGRKSTDLEADLRGINGFTGYGEIEYAEFTDGKRLLEIELRGVAGRNAEIYIDGNRYRSVPLDNGRHDETYDTSTGDAIPAITVGAQIDVHQNGDHILSGRMRRD